MDIDGRMDEKDKEGIIRFLKNFTDEIESGSLSIDEISCDIESIPINDGFHLIGYRELYRKLTIIFRET